MQIGSILSVTQCCNFQRNLKTKSEIFSRRPLRSQRHLETNVQQFHGELREICSKRTAGHHRRLFQHCDVTKLRPAVKCYFQHSDLSALSNWNFTPKIPTRIHTHHMCVGACFPILKHVQLRLDAKGEILRHQRKFETITFFVMIRFGNKDINYSVG